MTKKTKKKRPTKVRHRDATVKNSATVENGRHAARLTSQHKLELARRRARVAELAGEGKSLRDCEQLLRSEGFTHCDHATVAKDLKLERDRLTQATQATTAQHRQRVLAKLTLLEDRVRARWYDDPNYVSDLLGILDRVIKLLGLSQERHQAIISVDTKKRKLGGDFKNPGARWDLSLRWVNDHDFRSDSTGVAIPYGIYDLLANRGWVVVGVSHDTPAFAAHAIAHWWRQEVCSAIPAPGNSSS